MVPGPLIGLERRQAANDAIPIGLKPVDPLIEGTL